jgi:uncharacterized protein YbaR (Trm112 family)
MTARMAQLSPELLELLADPETHEPLTMATEAQFLALKAVLTEGKVKRKSGQPVSSEVDGALLTPSRRVAYLIEGGIPNLLIDERIELGDPL